jgi:hypothetical protein
MLFRVLALMCIAAASLLAVPHRVDAQDLASSIVGVWKLTSFARKEVGTDKTVDVFGENPVGYRVHTKGGHAFYLFFGKDRKAPTGGMTDADRIELFKSMTTAGGTYKIEGNKLFFQADVSASQTVSKLVYQFEIVGQKLSMMTDPVKNPSGGPDLVFVTTYERAE